MVVGTVSYLAFMIYEVTKGEEEVDIEEGPSSDTSSKSAEESTLKGVVYLLVGGLIIVLCSDDFINSVVTYAQKLSVNPVLLAFFLAPIASEMPEVLESIQLSRKGKSNSINIAYSNMVGGTISKTTFLCGLFSYFGSTKNYQWIVPNYSISLILLALAAAVASLIGITIPKLRKHHSYILFFLFAFISIVQYYLNSGLGEASSGNIH
eukprot:TRINITY_DN2373_c0_g1_i2.p1 TRINITY_DN2373_c0_g1~~TRINITY_DN2373_c0_g1_i2.p1  ORF type:complete len:208 (+),score=26.98 TRINITY_DN2373_c0_g1_i2:450-1073(+)